MAVATYASDLTDIIVDMASTTGWTALGGGAGGLVAPETDYFIQGANCISKAGWSTAVKGMIYNNGSGITVPSGKAVYGWLYYWAPNSLAVEAGAPGGLQLLIGSATTAYKAWDVRGSDTMIYGGWVCAVVDPTTTADDTTGSPSATLQYFGATANVPAAGPSKGQPLGIDAMRYGRDFTVTNGESGAYGTFAGAALFNDRNDVTNGFRRYGQFQAIDGGYLMQCRFLMGSSGTLVDFRDSNRSILIGRLPKVGSGFQRFEVLNASSNVSWTNISILALGTTTRGDFEVVDNATVTKTGCVFTDAGTWIYRSNSAIASTTYRRCNLVTQGGATFDECTFESTNDSAKALLSDDPSKLTGCSFVSSGTKHAIEISTAGTYAFTGNTFTGYAATDGSTGDEAVYNNSGGLVTLNISGGTTPSIRNGAGASTVVNSTVTVTVTPLTTGSEVRAYATGTSTELSGTESSTGSSFALSLPSGTAVDIVVLCYNPPKVPVRIENRSFTVNQNLDPGQRDDRNFSNP
jgi:hypothetical protein